MQPLFFIFWFGAGGYEYNNDILPWQLYFIELKNDYYRRICVKCSVVFSSGGLHSARLNGWMLVAKLLC